MTNGFARFKPGVSRRTLLLASSSLWTVIGLVLVAKGLYRWFFLPDRELLVLVAAIFTGTLKSLWILDHAAQKGISRILNFADGTCLGAVYSKKTWLLVLCMMIMGVILRNSDVPMKLLCFIYITIGWALLFSSRFAWNKWLKG